MGQILSAISGNETTSRKERPSSLSSRQYSQYSQYNIHRELPQLPRRKTESTITTPRSTQRSRDPEWFEKLYQAKQQETVNLYKIKQQEAVNLYKARQQQEAANLYKARQQEKASQVNKNTTSLPNRAVTISERKVTSGAKDNATRVSYNVVTISGKKTTSGVKENTTSLHRLSTTSERKTTSGVKDNTIHRPSVEKKKTTALGIKGNPTSLFDHPYDISSTSIENTTSLNREDFENIKRITQIVRNILARDINYVVYGNWSCPHWPRPCDNEDEWQFKYTRETFQRYLMLNSENKHNFFMKSCKGCNKKSLVSSFFLYKQQPQYAFKEPTVEIVCRLVWNNHYRVFAEWKCQRPQLPRHEWKSSYTWISLRNYIEKTPLKKGNYYVQKCYECREVCKVCKNKPKEIRGCEKCDHDTVLLGYSQLVQSSGGKPHKRWLCAKCKEGSTCRSDNNYRVPRRRNIELF